jgi:uncharacterized protein YajQ (UPF0234 family)
MPSFDIVSKVDRHEITNAIDQANREVTTRFDFKGTDSCFELAENTITFKSETDFQLKQMKEIFVGKLAKRQIDVQSFEYKEPQISHRQASQEVVVQQGLSSEMAKKIVKFIKDKQLKVQAAIQGDQVRVTGKKRDDLQDVIAALRKESFGLPLQFENFRD